MSDTVLNLAQQIEYANGSVVSKTIIKKKGGNLTLFAFDAGEELSEHTAPFEAMIQVVDGEAQITVGGEAHTVQAGQAIMLPAGIPHAVKAVEKFKMLLTMIKEG